MIKEDKSNLSNVDILSMEMGFAKLDIYNIKIDRESFTELEKLENRRLGYTMSRDDWSKHCDENNERTALKIKPIVDYLSKNFYIYQYQDTKMEYTDNWDLFFWCNCNKECMDLSYVTLDTNKSRTLEERFSDIEKAIKCITETGFDGLDITINYTVKYDDEKIQELAYSYFQKVKNTFIKYKGVYGKIKKIDLNYQSNITYGFFKKGARSRYYQLSDKDMMMLSMIE